MQNDVGINALVLDDQSGEHVGREGHRTSDGKMSACLVPEFANGVGAELQVVKEPFRQGDKLGARAGQGDLPCGALKKGASQLLLCRADHARQAGLRQMQLRRRCDEARIFRHRRDGHQLPNRQVWNLR